MYIKLPCNVYIRNYSNIGYALVVLQMRDTKVTGNIFLCNFFSQRGLIPGPPFLLGACTVVIAFIVALFIPEKPSSSSSSPQLSLSDKPHPDSKASMSSLAGVHINTPLPGSDEDTPPTASDEDFEPLLQDSIVWWTFCMKNKDPVTHFLCHRVGLSVLLLSEDCYWQKEAPKALFLCQKAVPTYCFSDQEQRE